MAIIRSRRIIVLVVGSILVALIVLTVAVELVVRSRIDATLASLTEDTPGIEASPAGGLALWSLATGRVAVEISLDDTALQGIVDCRTDRDVSVSTTAAGIGVETDLELRGRSVPVHLTLVPQKEADVWTLVPNAVDVASFSLPPQRVAGILGDRAPDWLATGIPLSSSGDLSVTGVKLAEAEARLSISTPIARQSTDGESPFAAITCK